MAIFPPACACLHKYSPTTCYMPGPLPPRETPRLALSPHEGRLTMSSRGAAQTFMCSFYPEWNRKQEKRFWGVFLGKEY